MSIQNGCTREHGKEAATTMRVTNIHFWVHAHSFQHSIHSCHHACQIAVSIQKYSTMLGIAYAFSLWQDAFVLSSVQSQWPGVTAPLQGSFIFSPQTPLFSAHILTATHGMKCNITSIFYDLKSTMNCDVQFSWMNANRGVGREKPRKERAGTHYALEGECYWGETLRSACCLLERQSLVLKQ